MLALLFIVLVSASFSLLGFILGIWAEGFEKLQIVPMLILTPLTFLGGTFYSISMLAEPWRTIALFNPIVVPRQRAALDLLRQGRRDHRGLARADAGDSSRSASR